MSGALAGVPAAFAAQGDCSQPVTNGTNPTASDCLFVLRAAVGSETCNPECICDTSGGGGVTASDALICLKVAVGQAVELNCPCPTDTSSTTSSTTVTTSSTTTSSTVSDTTTTTIGGTTTTVDGGTTTTVDGGTTTTVDGGTTTTVDGGTTTTVGGGTTTTTIGGGTTTTVGPTTTTTLGTSSCPTSAELTILAGTGNQCTNNGDCLVGTCDEGIGRCLTGTELDTGWTGIAHDSDLTDRVFIAANLGGCTGEGPCGECNINGIIPDPRYCRCANNNQTPCDQPFVEDVDSCGEGNTCNCYVGPPLALSAGNTPACVVNRLSQDVSGTVNVDSGDANTFLNLRSVVFLGESLVEPCPYCDGDVTENDGVADGECVLGPNEGQACDSNGFNQSFPAPGGGGHSLDCFPDTGKNVSGQGLIIELNQTTDTTSLGSEVTCGLPPSITLQCHCGVCTGNSQLACTSDAVCAEAEAGTCVRAGSFAPSPNQCDGECEEQPDGEALCAGGPSDKGCDAIVRANGDLFIQCQANADCEPQNIGVDAGACTLTKQRECFLPTITATGDPDPVQPIGVATFCIPPTANPGINSVAGLPGPGRVFNQGAVEFVCASGTYEPGVGCP